MVAAHFSTESHRITSQLSIQGVENAVLGPNFYIPYKDRQNFAHGDGLLWTNNNPGPLDITFSTCITEFATQIQADWYGTGMVTISAYDASNVLLGSFSLASVSTSNADDSATLIGIAISS